MFGISASFASEDYDVIQSNNDSDVYVSMEESQDIDLSSSDENDNLAGENDYGNFTELQQLIDGKDPGSTIYLNKSYVYNNDSLKNGVVINKELTIDGQGHSIDGNFSSRLFYVNSSKITLKNIVLLNGKLGNSYTLKNNYGAAIYFEDNITGAEFKNVQILYNNVYTIAGNQKLYGGAFYFAGTVNNVVFEDCIIKNNSLTSDMPAAFYGGAFYFKDVVENLTFRHCNLDNNFIYVKLYTDSTDSYGGVICFDSNTTNISYVDSNFTNSGMTYYHPYYSSSYISQNTWGGVICYRGYSPFNNFTNCNFKNNRLAYGGYVWTGKAHGMAVYFANSSYNIFDHCNFDRHVDGYYGTVCFEVDTYFNKFISSNFTHGDAHFYAGAIYAYLYNSTIIDCYFAHNYAYYTAAIRAVCAGSEVINSTFESNTVSYNFAGSAIEKIENAKIINCTFDNNKGAIDAIYNSVIDGCNFTNNYLRDDQSTSRGAAIHEVGGNVSIYDSNFIHNIGSSGGAIDVFYSANLTMVNVTFKDNKATYVPAGGGAIDLSGSYSTKINCVGINCTFENNTGDSGGAIYCYQNVNLKFENTTFANNTATSEEFKGGGAIYMLNSYGVDVEFNNVTFADNHAGFDGGAMVVQVAPKLYNVNFTNNSAGHNGGAIYGSGLGLVIINSTFSQNSAGGDGGVFYSTGYLTDSEINNCNFTQNHANKSGGVIIASRIQNVNIEDSNFIDNSVSEGEGGVIFINSTSYMDPNSDINFVRVNFTNNSANGGSSHGGVLYILGYQTENIKFIDTNFTNNSAAFGGAVAFDNKDSQSTWYPSFTKYVDFINSTFMDNSALDGGAIYMIGVSSENNIIGVLFVNNTAENGGAVYFTGESNIIDDSQFKENNAIFGGAIYIDGMGNLVKYSNFTNNTAKLGGAIFNDYNADGTTINNCNFNDNSVFNEDHIYGPDEGYGGSIHFSEGEHNISESNFWDNCAHFGSAISFWGSAKAKIVNTSFKDNKLDNISIWIVIIDEQALDIGVGLLSGNTQLDAIYSENDDLEFVNVTYYGEGTKLNTDNGVPVFTPVIANQNVTLEFYDENGVCVSNSTNLTGVDGLATFDDFGIEYDHYYLKAYHLENKYYAYGETYDEIGIMGDFQRLQYLINKIKENETLTLTRNFTFTDGLDDPYETIKINKSITIDGNGFTIDAFNQAAIFEIVPQEVEIQTPTGVDIIYVSPKVTFENINFVNSSTFNSYGSMIFGRYVENITIENCNFTQTIQYYADAIVFEISRNVTISNSIFNNCSSNDGGAICLYETYNSTIVNCSFINCTDSAIGVYNSDNVSVSDCNFTECRGTARFMYSNNLDVSGCNSTHCYGGFYFEDSSNVTISDCSFEFVNGTSIYVQSYGMGDNITISHCNFTQGGTAIVTYQITNSTIEHCNFINNYAGAVSLDAINTTLSNCNFTNNGIRLTSGREPEARGGALFVSGEHNEIYECVFDGNYVYCHGRYWFGWGYGGAMFLSGDSHILRDSVFSNNYVDADPGEGGAICLGGASNALISNVTFVNNSAGAGGAISFSSYYAGWPTYATLYSINDTFDDCKFINNTANNGGAISLSEYDQGTNLFNSSEFVGNRAYYNGGALYLQSTNSKIFTDYMWCNRTAMFSDEDITKLIWNYTLISNSKFENNTDYELKIVANESIAGKNQTIEIILPSNTTSGIVYVNVTDKNGNFILDNESNPINASYAFKNGYLRLTTSELGLGEYFVSVICGDDTYSWNEDYYYHINSTIFGVYNHLSLNVSANKTIFADEEVTIIANVYADATNSVNITVFNQNHTLTFSDIPVVNGNVTYNVSGLWAGYYDVIVTYNGDGNYGHPSNHTNFTVLQRESRVNVSAGITYFPNDAVITVHVPANQKGNVTIYIDNRNFTKEITTGSIDFNVSGLSIKKWEVRVEFLENRIYKSNSNRTEFDVVKQAIDFKVNVGSGTVVEDVVFTITNVSNGFAGNVSIVDSKGNVLYNSTFMQLIDVGKLPAGEYTVNVTIYGDDNYNASSKIATFKVSKLTLDAKVNVDNETVLDDVIFNITHVSSGFAGKVKIVDSKGNVLYDDAFANIINVGKLPATNYVANVTFYGDDKYGDKTVNVKFTVSKVDLTANVTVKNATTAEGVVFNIANVSSGYNGNVIIVGSDGSLLYNGSIKDSVNIGKLPAGAYTVNVTLNGDDKYNGKSVEIDFIVSNNGLGANVTVEDNITVNDNVVFNITDVPSDFKGNVSIVDSEGNVLYNGSVKDSIDVGKFPLGDNSVNVTFYGDSNYESQSVEVNFTVSKANLAANVTVSDNLTADDNVTFNIADVPSDFKGNVSIVDSEGNVLYNGSVKDSIDVGRLSSGDNSVNVTFYGDENYADKTTVVNFKISPAKPKIEANDMIRGWNSPYDYQAKFLDGSGSPLANTDVMFSVGGKNYTTKTDSNGIARLNESKLAIGEYNITCFNTKTGENVTQKLSIVARLIKNKNLTMDFRDGSRFIVCAIGDNGKPVGEGEKVTIKVNGITYVCKTDKKGYARLTINLNPKTYIITAEYKKYKTTNKLVVKQTLKLVKKTIKVKKGKKIIISAKLKWSNGKAIKGKTIKFKFRGKTFKAKTNKKGLAKVTVKNKKLLSKLKKGEKYRYSAKYLTNNVKGKVKVKK